MKKYFSSICIIFVGCIHITSCQQNKKENPTPSTFPENTVSRPTLDQYWNQYDFTDTVAMKNPDIGEQAFVDFIGLLGKIPAEQVPTQIHNMLAGAEADSTVFAHFASLSERYLYHPNSPIYNESYYEAVLAFLTTSKWSDTADKLRAKKSLDLIRKNNPGEKAENFLIRLSSGKRSKMTDIEAPHLLLFFYEPGCSSCEEAILLLSQNAGFKRLVDEGEVKVLAIYPSGDKKIWEDYQPSLPQNWINGFDEKMHLLKSDLYDLKASPTIYLLDGEKKVVLKDTQAPTLLQYLSERYNKF